MGLRGDGNNPAGELINKHTDTEYRPTTTGTTVRSPSIQDLSTHRVSIDGAWFRGVASDSTPLSRHLRRVPSAPS
jgi:hypothetical protein